jgi:hypothetical protein
MEETKKAEWILRIGIFGMFLGHGIFAVGVKEGWIKYLTAVGFSPAGAATILPIIGYLDIAVAFCVLFWPIRAVLACAAFWAFATALIRPVGGDPIWDFVERWANWAAPLALLMLQGIPKTFKEWFSVKS